MGSIKKEMSIFQKTMREMMTTTLRTRSMRMATLSQGPREKAHSKKTATMTKMARARAEMMMTMMMKRKVATMPNSARGELMRTGTQIPLKDRSE